MLSEKHAKVFNSGERLVPYKTLGLDELVRHRSAYDYVKKVIEADLRNGDVTGPVTIVDLGSGVGHGCAWLSKIPNSQIVGVDASELAIEYSREYYSAHNIEYVAADLVSYIDEMRSFDYVFSRNVLEHIEDGLKLTKRIKWKNRLLFDVPYAEKPTANSHHLVHNITEQSIKNSELSEVYFEDINGGFFDVARKPSSPYNIMFADRVDRVPAISELLEFPLEPWSPRISDRLVYGLRRIRKKFDF